MFKPIVQKLKLQYMLCWAIPILLVVAFEIDLIPIGMYADDPRMVYVLETAGILTTIICVPLSLKLFSVVLKKKLEEAHLAEALSKYVLWSGIRLTILDIGVLFNIVVYFLTFSNVGAFCGLIVLTACVFCLPSEKRLRQELNITNEE